MVDFLCEKLSLKIKLLQKFTRFLEIWCPILRDDATSKAILIYTPFFQKYKRKEPKNAKSTYLQ